MVEKHMVDRDAELAPDAGPDAPADANLDEVAPGQLAKVPNDATEIAAPPVSRREAARLNQKALTEQLAAANKRLDELGPLQSTVEEMRAAQGQVMQLLASQNRQQQQFQQQGGDAHDGAMDPAVELEVQEHLEAAEAAMAKSDFKAYQAALMKAGATQARGIAKAEAALAAQSSRGGDYPPEISALRAQYRKVVTHPAGEAALRYQDAMLASKGIPMSYDRIEKAYEMANTALFGGGKPASSNGDRAARAAYSAPGAASHGAPAPRGGTKLPMGASMGEIRRLAAAGRMTEERYIQQYFKLHPEEKGGDE